MTELEKRLNYCVEPAIRPFSGPLFFGQSLDSPNDVENSGAFALLDTGVKKLLVTCFHVWDSFQRERRGNANLKIFLCFDSGPPIVFSPAEPIDSEKELDIATFSAGPLENADSRRFYPAFKLRPPPLKLGNRIAISGFPAIFRKVDQKDIAFGRFPIGLNITDLTPRTIKADVSKMKAMFYKDPPNKPIYPGISGSPCFLSRDGFHPRLIGLASYLLFNSLSIARTEFINPDGTVDRGRS